MSGRIKRFLNSFHLPMASKLTLALGSLVAILLISSVISILEFRRMSTYVSGLVAENIQNITTSEELSITADEYNTMLLAIVGDADNRITTDFDATPYISVNDSIIDIFVQKQMPGIDSLVVAYSDYLETSKQLDSIIVSDFVDTREWYFTTLQPKYNHFRTKHTMLNEGIHESLKRHSVNFDDSFYRSMMPGEVSVLAGIVLAMLLLFFMIIYYIHPLKKMLGSLDAYRRYNHPYNVYFEGDDELQELNGDIADLIEENINLKKRVRERER